MFKHTLPLLLAILTLPAVALAQGTPDGGTPPAEPPAAAPAAPTAAPPPANNEPAIEVDQTKSDLEREQAEMEEGNAATAEQSQTDVVVESKAELERTHQTEADKAASKDHAGQIGIRAGLGVPLLMVGFRYGKNGIPCDGELADHNTCRRKNYMGLGDLDLSVGVTKGLEITGLVRLGFAKDEVSGTSPLTFGLGIRSYMSPRSMFKFYLGVKGLLDVTNSKRPNWKNPDVGVRGEVGIQLDVLRYLGIYAQVAESVTFLRSLYFVTDFSGGLQARFP